MATDQEVNTGSLSDKAWALKQVLERAHSANLTAVERNYLDRIEQWVRQVDPMLANSRAEHAADQTPPLDLTWAELDEVVTKVVIDQHPDPKRRRQLGRLWHDVDQLHKQSTPLKLTSWLIAAGLIVLAALNILDFAVLKDLSPSFVLGMNLGAVFMVSCFWALHHFGTLLPHVGDVEEHIMSVLALNESKS